MAQRDGPVAAVYHWAVYAPGVAVAAVTLIAEHLQKPEYRSADLYGSGSTVSGRQIMLATGFVRVEDSHIPELHRYVRFANRSAS